jgi:protein-tyrosine phosphatase
LKATHVPLILDKILKIGSNSLVQLRDVEKLENLRLRLTLFSDRQWSDFVSKVQNFRPFSSDQSSNSNSPALPPPPPPIGLKQKKIRIDLEESLDAKLISLTSARPPYPSEILEDFLYLGGMQTAEDRRALADLNITRIVNMTSEHINPFMNDSSLRYLHFPIDDKPDTQIEQFFDPCFLFIDEAKREQKRCLVHCAMGISRSATIVLYYVMRSQRLPLKHAYDVVSAMRPYINPNVGFLRQLQNAEEALGFQVKTEIVTDDENPRKIPTLIIAERK